MSGVLEQVELEQLRKDVPDLRTENDQLKAQIAMLTNGLENCCLLAARNIASPWSRDILRFCAAAGLKGSPLRFSEEETNVR